VQKFFPTVYCMDFVQYVYTLCQAIFVCYFYRLLKKSVYLWFHHVVSMLFLFCFLLHLSVCYASLWLIPHPIIVITNLRIHGMYVCVCAHFHFSFIHPYTHLLNKIYVAAGMILMTFERWISVFPTLFFTRFVLKNVICKFYF